MKLKNWFLIVESPTKAKRTGRNTGKLLVKLKLSKHLTTSLSR